MALGRAGRAVLAGVALALVAGLARCARRGQPQSTVHDVGRLDRSTPGVARFEWSGSGVLARFRGTGVSARLSGNPAYLTVVVDGAVSVLAFDGQPALVPLASGLGPGEHQIELYRRTEAFMEELRLSELVVTDGALVPSPPPFSRGLELIGDSITAGYGNEGTSAACGFEPATENEYLTYGAIAARALGAEHHTLAWSGIGMLRDTHGRVDGQMPVRYERTLPTNPASRWDFTKWTPDVVVINLGTNDFSRGDPGPPYREAYLAFLERLRRRYPRAQVFCAMGPMDNSERWRKRLQGIVEDRRAAGDAQVHFLEFPPQDGALGYGCNAHPSLATHRLMANVLVSAIERVTGWSAAGAERERPNP